jgi:hypothetical protein
MAMLGIVRPCSRPEAFPRDGWHIVLAGQKERYAAIVAEEDASGDGAARPRHFCDASSGTGERAPFSAPEIAKPMMPMAHNNRQSAVNWRMWVRWLSLIPAQPSRDCTSMLGTRLPRECGGVRFC